MRALVNICYFLLIHCSSAQETKQKVVVKTGYLRELQNERLYPRSHQSVPSIRRYIDSIQDPPLLVLENLDTDLLLESKERVFPSSEVKHIARSILRALSALHSNGIVHTGRQEPTS